MKTQGASAHAAETPLARTRETPLALTRRARRIHRSLAERYPDAHCELDFDTPLELLVATILSAQCTDARVNQVTPALFARYRTAADYAGADRGELESMIVSTGFFRAKSDSLLKLGARLVTDFGGTVPARLEQLVTLPGVSALPPGPQTAWSVASVPLAIVLVVLGIVAVPAILYLVPVVIAAWLRLRRRDLATLLEASGWAINTRLYLDRALAIQLTRRPPDDRIAARTVAPTVRTNRADRGALPMGRTPAPFDRAGQSG
ncbi:MAG: hypothetical protein ABMB14_23610 [Myxococcota bacterium]